MNIIQKNVVIMSKSAIMKRNIVTACAWLMCIICTTIWTGCESTLINLCEEQTNNRILQFREYCYDASGRVKLSHQEGNAETEWVIPVSTDQEVSTIFSQLTGLEISSTGNNEYSYHSEDHRYVCRFVRDVTHTNNRYASLYVWVEGCPEIEVIYFVGT